MLLLPASLVSNLSRALRPGAFLLGVVALLGVWLAVFQVESLFAESHLASYYCCLLPSEVQQLGALERLVSDFFRTSPGRELPGLLFIAANLALFIARLRKAAGASWLPAAFGLWNCAYLLAAIAAWWIASNISSAIVGPQSGAYAGYHRTWYGLVAHFAVWGFYFTALTRWSRTLPRMAS